MPFLEDFTNLYINNYFIETGTYQGDTVNAVNNSKNFKHIISMELSDVFYNNCKTRFINNDNIQIIKGNSRYDLSPCINSIKESITFWLDSHWSGVPNVGCDPETRCPVLFELEQIKKHDINTHTIMVDDMRLMDGNHFPVFQNEIVKKLLEINANYKLKYYDDYTSTNDILVAYI